MKSLEEIIERYSDDLFLDLGFSNLSEEQKADVYARVQQHIHQIVLDLVKNEVAPDDLQRLQDALEQEDYDTLAGFLKDYPSYESQLEEKIQSELKNLKSNLMSNGQEHVGDQK